MGITILYSMTADDPRVVVAALKVVMEEAEKAGYRYAVVRDEGIAFMQVCPIFGDVASAAEWLGKAWGGYAEERFDDVPEEPPFTWLKGSEYGTPSFMWRGAAERTGFKGKPVECEGVIVHCDTAESFNLIFWRLGRYYVCSEFTKTQPFTVDEVQPNTYWHKWICQVLRKLEKLPWWNFYVYDEAGYYETSDEGILQHSLEEASRLIWAISSAIQEAADEAGIPVRSVVGGEHDVKRLRDKLREGNQMEMRQRTRRQTTLDDYMYESLDNYGGDPHRPLFAAGDG